MGLFSGKTIINVASSVYNMAGEEKDRPIFLKNLVIRNVLSGTKRSMGDTIATGYQQGPGIKFRSFYRWATANYGLIGMPTGQIFSNDIKDTNPIALNIPHQDFEQNWIQDARIGDSDYSQWAEQWMMENYPGELATAWEADFNDATKVVTVKRAGGSTQSFVANNFVAGAKYIFADYTVAKYGVLGGLVPGTKIFLADTQPNPSTTGFAVTSFTSVDRVQYLNRTEYHNNTYSDGRAPDQQIYNLNDFPPTVTRTEMRLEKALYKGNDASGDAKYSETTKRLVVGDKKIVNGYWTYDYTTDLGGGITKYTHVDVYGEMLANDRWYQDDTQKFTDVQYGALHKWIYRIGTGIGDLDNMINQRGSLGQFYPMLPVRLNNKYISELAGWTEKYKVVRKAYRKATDGASFLKLMQKIDESDDIADMDYIYVVYGVTLNTIDLSARLYLYKFFQRLMDTQTGGAGSGAAFANQMNAYANYYNSWQSWRSSFSGSSTGGMNSEPPKLSKPTLPTNEVKVQRLGSTPGTDINFDMRISWNFITEKDNVAGLGKPGAKKDDLWIVFQGTTTIADPTYTGQGSYPGWSGVVSNNVAKYDTIRIYWQYADNAYRYMDIAGLVHKNYVYGGKNVTITAKEALDDGEESGFIVPLHYDTYRAMRLIDATQMSTACVYLVFNVYEKKKQKWYQSFFFRILLVVVIAVISTLFTGGAGFGLLGAHAAVGASFGLTGMAAAIVGSVVNALSAMILTTIISTVTEKLGPLGAVLGAVIGIVISGAMQSFQAGNGFNFNFADLMKADNIMKLLDGVGKGYTAYIQSSITGMQDELLAIQDGANDELKRIREMYSEQFGIGGGQIDPFMFVGKNNPVLAESRDTFLTRTLMTGSDVATMSSGMLNDFVELNTTLPNAFT